jgi:hypothetical protein
VALLAVAAAPRFVPMQAKHKPMYGHAVPLHGQQTRSKHVLNNILVPTRAWECVHIAWSHTAKLELVADPLRCRSPCCCCCCCLRTRALQTFSVDDTIVPILREQPGGIAPPSSDERAQSPDRAELLLNVCHHAPTPPPFTCFVHLHRIPLHCAQRAGHTSLGHIHYASFDKHTT